MMEELNELRKHLETLKTKKAFAEMVHASIIDLGHELTNSEIAKQAELLRDLNRKRDELTRRMEEKRKRKQSVDNEYFQMLQSRLGIEHMMGSIPVGQALGEKQGLGIALLHFNDATYDTGMVVQMVGDLLRHNEGRGVAERSMAALRALAIHPTVDHDVAEERDRHVEAIRVAHSAFCPEKHKSMLFEARHPELKGK
jgi:hypothetical protein